MYLFHLITKKTKILNYTRILNFFLYILTDILNHNFLKSTSHSIGTWSLPSTPVLISDIIIESAASLFITK